MSNKFVGQLEISVDKISRHTFQVLDETFLDSFESGYFQSNINHHGFKVNIEKCNDVDVPVDTLDDIYRLKTGSSKNNHYLVIPKDCNIYVQMHENESISFKPIRKINKQHVPKRTSTGTCEICCCIK